ncbi:MAG: adenylate cyclase [Fluviicola sp.]|nr:MAG: adenylate cyclase [Fluviicola sp.]
MGVEIERKFLVKKEKWQAIRPSNGELIIQGYLQKDPNKTVRVRVKNNSGYITIKGKSKGITRLEFEYEIPVNEAKEMIQEFCDRFIEKTRYFFEHEGFTWEVDEFLSPKKGLILAEIELNSEEQKFSLPNWIDKEVSDDLQYFNSNMI